jgi:hypothetical protein
MLKVDIVAEDRRAVAASAAGEFARCGWVVEVVLVDFGEPGERTFFAVGLEHARESEQAVLRYPGLAPADLRRARRLLSPRELTALKLRTGAIRPYGWNMGNVP